MCYNFLTGISVPAPLQLIAFQTKTCLVKAIFNGDNRVLVHPRRIHIRKLYSRKKLQTRGEIFEVNTRMEEKGC